MQLRDADAEVARFGLERLPVDGVRAIVVEDAVRGNCRLEPLRGRPRLQPLDPLLRLLDDAVHRCTPPAGQAAWRRTGPISPATRRHQSSLCMIITGDAQIGFVLLD